MRVGLADLDASAAEPDLVHDAAGRQREEAGDHQCASEEADHGGAVAPHRVVVGVPDAERQHHQREDRQQVDGAPQSPEVDLVTQNELMATTSIRAAQV